MDATVSRSVGTQLESHLTDRPVLFLKSGHRIQPPKAMRDQTELGILSGLRYRIAGVGNNKTTRPAQHRVSMTNKTLISVMTCSQSVGVGMNLRKVRIEFAGNRRAVGYVRAPIARRLKLAGA
jgi:hypothetical protein